MAGAEMAACKRPDGVVGCIGAVHFGVLMSNERRSEAIAAELDISRGESTEKELDALIRRRHDQRCQSEGERLEEELYEPSVRAWRERQEAEKRAACFEYHQGQAERLRRTMGELIARHEAAAKKLMEHDKTGDAA
jgi:hypothetical protein